MSGTVATVSKKVRAPQQIRTYPSNTVIYQSGGTVPVKLTKGALIRNLILELKGQPTCTAANNVNTKVLRGDEWAVIKRLDLIANQGEYIRSFTGYELWAMNWKWFGVPPQITPTLGDGATANPTFDSLLYIPFMGRRGMEYKTLDSVLDTRKLSDLSINVTWGAYTDINASATAWTVNPTLKIWQQDSFGVDAVFTDTTTRRIVTSISASVTGQRIDLGVGPVFKSFLINVADTTNATDAAAVMTALRLKSGSTTFFDIGEIVARNFYSKLRSDNPNVERALNTTSAIGAASSYATANYARIMQSSSFDPLAWYYIDLASDGYNTEAIDTLGLSEFYLEIDVNAAATVTVIPLQLFPNRNVSQ